MLSRHSHPSMRLQKITAINHALTRISVFPSLSIILIDSQGRKKGQEGRKAEKWVLRAAGWRPWVSGGDTSGIQHCPEMTPAVGSLSMESQLPGIIPLPFTSSSSCPRSCSGGSGTWREWTWPRWTGPVWTSSVPGRASSLPWSRTTRKTPISALWSSGSRWWVQPFPLIPQLEPGVSGAHCGSEPFAPVFPKEWSAWTPFLYLRGPKTHLAGIALEFFLQHDPTSGPYCPSQHDPIPNPYQFSQNNPISNPYCPSQCNPTPNPTGLPSMIPFLIHTNFPSTIPFLIPTSQHSPIPNPYCPFQHDPILIPTNFPCTIPFLIPNALLSMIPLLILLLFPARSHS